MALLRTCLFYLFNCITVAPWSLVVITGRLFSVHTRYKLCTVWTRSAIWSARVICGIRWKVEGWENLPDAPAIVLPKHQSTWETFWLPSFLPRDLTFVLDNKMGDCKDHATLLQALLAAKAGAYIVSPFVGRLDDIGQTGMELVRDIVEIYRIQGYKTQVLAASIRGPMHVVDAARAGAHIATMPLKVLDAMFNHPLTDKGLDQFLKDWEKVFQEAPAGS